MGSLTQEADLSEFMKLKDESYNFLTLLST